MSNLIAALLVLLAILIVGRVWEALACPDPLTKFNLARMECIVDPRLEAQLVATSRHSQEMYDSIRRQAMEVGSA